MADSPPIAETADPEDQLLVTLARSARARVGGAEGAAVRDQDGRTYAAANIEVGDLRLSALEVAVAMAASSGVDSLEAAVVVTDAAGFGADDVSVVRALGGSGVRLLRTGLDGTPLELRSHA